VPVLKSITFAYDTREDRILAAVNPGHPDAWSCWLTRRLALALLERTGEFLASTSSLVQRASADHRGEILAFEQDAAIARTAKAITQTPAEILQSSTTSAELAKQLTISNQGNGFRMELRGEGGGNAAGVLARDELQRVLQMLQETAGRAGWLITPARPHTATATEESNSKTSRH
jgi:hypothetical protein